MWNRALVGVVLLVSIEVSDRQPPDELVAFVGHRIATEAFPLEEGDFNYEFRAKYRVLQVIHGAYAEPELEFMVYDHYGVPGLFKYDTALVYVSRYGQRWVHEKYQFQPVYRTTDGRWAGCGDPNESEFEAHKGLQKAVPLLFDPPVSFPVETLTEEEIAERYPAAHYERRGTRVICRAGAYAEQLFAVKRDGVLRARGFFN